MASIKQLLDKASRQLAEYSPSPRVDAEILLCHVLGCTRTHLFTWPDKLLEDNHTDRFNVLLTRRCEGTPVAYLTGQREFWSLDFKVSPDTLIPRPETELLVETVLKKFSSADKLSLLDMGTGTGAIAISIAHEKPKWEITATDISAASLAIAQINSEQHKTSNLKLTESDWFQQLGDEPFDVIVSNPPYIAETDKHLRQGDVRFEPAGALVSGSDGMNAIRHICAHAKQHLKPGGALLLEHGYDQKQAAHDCFLSAGFHNIGQYDDLASQPRITVGYMPSVG